MPRVFGKRGLPRMVWVLVLGVLFASVVAPHVVRAQTVPSTQQEQNFSAPFLNQPRAPVSASPAGPPDPVIGHIASQAGVWIGILSAMATRLFFLLVIIDFAWMVMQWLLGGREQTGEFLGQWVVKLIGVNVVYFLVLVHGWELSQLIIFSIFNAGGVLPGLGGNEVRTQDFQGIALTGVGIATPMIVQAIVYALIPNIAFIGFSNLQLPLLWTELFGATAVIGAYVLMAGSVLLVWIEMYVTTSIGVLMLGFSGSRWTQGFGWEKYLSLAFSIGIKMLMTYVCVDLAMAIGNSILPISLVPGVGAIYAGFVASILSLIVYNVPNFAASLMQGASNSAAGPALGFAQSMASQMTSAMQQMAQSMQMMALQIREQQLERDQLAQTQTSGGTLALGAGAVSATARNDVGQRTIPTVLDAPADEATDIRRQYAPLGSGQPGGAPTGLTDRLADGLFGEPFPRIESGLGNGAFGAYGIDGLAGRPGRDGMDAVPAAGLADLGDGRGAFVAENGTVVLPDATLVGRGGVVQSADGAYVTPDGRVVYPDGVTVLPNGDVVATGGEALGPAALFGRRDPVDIREAAEAARVEAAEARSVIEEQFVREQVERRTATIEATPEQLALLARLEGAAGYVPARAFESPVFATAMPQASMDLARPLPVPPAFAEPPLAMPPSSVPPLEAGHPASFAAEPPRPAPVADVASVAAAFPHAIEAKSPAPPLVGAAGSGFIEASEAASFAAPHGDMPRAAGAGPVAGLTQASAFGASVPVVGSGLENQPPLGEPAAPPATASLRHGDAVTPVRPLHDGAATDPMFAADSSAAKPTLEPPVPAPPLSPPPAPAARLQDRPAADPIVAAPAPQPGSTLEPAPNAPLHPVGAAAADSVPGSPPPARSVAPAAESAVSAFLQPSPTASADVLAARPASATPLAEAPSSGPPTLPPTPSPRFVEPPPPVVTPQIGASADPVTPPAGVTRAHEPAAVTRAHEPADVARAHDPAAVTRAHEPADVARANEPPVVTRANDPAAVTRSDDPADVARANQPAASGPVPPLPAASDVPVGTGTPSGANANAGAPPATAAVAAGNTFGLFVDTILGRSHTAPPPPPASETIVRETVVRESTIRERPPLGTPGGGIANSAPDAGRTEAPPEPMLADPPLLPPPEETKPTAFADAASRRTFLDEERLRKNDDDRGGLA
jgi:P-type conjugative transfer protein TrbL